MHMQTYHHIPASVKRWIEDKDFILHCLTPTPESEVKWKHYLREHPESEADMREAQRILLSTRLNPAHRPAEESNRLWERIAEDMRRSDSKRRHRRVLTTRYVTAACITTIVFIASWLLWATFSPSPDKMPLTAELTAIDTLHREVTLISDNHQPIQIENNALISCDSLITIHARGEKTHALQNEASTPTGGTNTLIVPYGKRSSLLLADGSKVWINSGSVLHFPSIFKGKERRIQVEGEIYIEVAHDSTRPFFVETSQMAINVLGTKFNVSAYRDDDSQSVVLVEGKVNVRTAGEGDCTLVPDQRLCFDTTDRLFRVDRVDVSYYTSWKEGILQFRGETMEEIALRLSRYYNVHIHCSSSVAGKCTMGKLLLFDDIHQVMKTFSLLYDIRYTVEDGEIRIL